MIAANRIAVFAILFSVLALAPRAEAKRAVGLGVDGGVVLPASGGDVSFDPAFAWGFYTDIPLISTFHITPSALVYKLDPGEGGLSATDVSLNFKFMVPLGPLDVFVGATAGVTSARYADVHVGALAGFALNLVSNLDIHVRAAYRLLIQDPDNVNNVMITAGPLFRFEY